MKRIPLTIMGISLLCSCHDDLIMDDKSFSNNNESMRIGTDSIMIYKMQSSKGEILKNLIRYENDRFFLDLSPSDAFELGVSPEEYENAKIQMEKLNTTNLKYK